MKIFSNRYPDIDFFLSFFPYEKRKLPTDPKALESWIKGQNLEEIEILYLVGLIGFPLPKPIDAWLKTRKERTLIFIEEDLGAFASYSNAPLLENPQVHFHYAKEDPIEELAQKFPSDRLAIFEGKLFDAAHLQRRSAALSALYSDVLYSHKIVENVLAHYHRLHDCFDAIPRAVRNLAFGLARKLPRFNDFSEGSIELIQPSEKSLNPGALAPPKCQISDGAGYGGAFKNVPAIICGAGPSLEKSFPTLKNSYQKALIFAGGSAITVLSKNNIRPHFAIALDPNEEEFERLKQSTYFEGPFLFAPRLHRHIFSTANGPFGYLKTDTGGLFENYLEQKLNVEGEPFGPDMGPEAFSVTTLAVSYAYALGCNPIILAGVDLAYTSGKRYASGVAAEKGQPSDPRALEKSLLRTDIHGNPVETLLKWVMESDCISAFAKSHPETHFLNASEGGLGFAGIPNLSLREALQELPMTDLDGTIHAWIQTSPLLFEKEKLFPLIDDLEESLERCETLCEQILLELDKKKETGILILFKTDFEEEEAYQSFLKIIASALDHILPRYFPHVDPQEGKWQWEQAKYQELKLQIGKFKQIFQKQKLQEYRRC